MMMANHKQEFASTVRGELRNDEPMSRHTSWRVGGPAKRFYRPVDVDDLTLFLQQLPEGEPVFWLGLGSNLLVRDGGLPETVICTTGVLNNIELVGDTGLRVESGVACAKVARFSASSGLCNAEFMIGIPGTMGGALAMNAGAFGSETWSLVKTVETIDSHGKCHVREPKDFQIAYRDVRGQAGEWFTAAVLDLSLGEGETSQQLIKDLLAKRSATQPIGKPSGGSVFRNPEGDHAGRLIEDCGLKGFSIGGACVSEKHANFIVNTGTAKAADIEALITHIMDVVKEKHGIGLIPEVHIVGNG